MAIKLPPKPKAIPPKLDMAPNEASTSEAAVNDNLTSGAAVLIEEMSVTAAHGNGLHAPVDLEMELPGIVDTDEDEDEAEQVELTEDRAAHLFVQEHGDEFRYDHEIGAWYHWTGSRWQKMKTGLPFHIARLLLRKMRGDSTRMATKRAVEGVEGMVARDPAIAITSDRWDANPLHLGTPDGTIDLKTGDLLKPNPEDYISRQTSVGPALPSASCPEFAKFLDAATGGDKGVQRFVQQYAGYCLTGLTIEQVLLFVYGPGGNGKSVLQTIIKEVMGDYAATSAMETFVASKHPRHLTELAMLHRARFVGASETEKRQRWSEARINQLTGGDRITANFMRRDHFSFDPKFKLMIVGNHKPNLSSVNDAARRRFIIVPFLHKPKKPDPKLLEKLRAEYPAILRWMVDGCLDWQQNGLVIPDLVKMATEEYFDEQDTLGGWLSECCERHPSKKASASDLFSSWKDFAEANGEAPGSMKTFAAALAQRGFQKVKSGVNFYLGVALKGPALVED